MKLLTFWNVAGLGLGVFGVAMIVDALPKSGSAALAQSAVVTNVSSVLSSANPDSLTPTSDSLANLLRVGERTFEISFDSSVSSQVLSNSVVRKIAYGNDSMINVVNTPTGTYSTDGLASPHILYPGISVVETKNDLANLNLQVLLNGDFVDLSALAQNLSGS